MIFHQDGGLLFYFYEGTSVTSCIFRELINVTENTFVIKKEC
jgi:hypothetical protein